MKSTKTYLVKEKRGGFEKTYKVLKSAIKYAKGICLQTHGDLDFYVYDNETGELVFSTELKEE